MSRTIDAALMALEMELLEWPGYILEEISRGHTWSSRGPEESIHLDGWFCIVKEREGPKDRGHYQGDGRTIIEAVDGLTVELVSRRTNPHRWHIEDWMQEGRFVIGCADCEKEAADLFAGQVDWVPA